MKIIDISTEIKYNNINSITEWQKLINLLEQEKQQLGPNEKIGVSFAYIGGHLQPNPYIAQLIKDDTVILICIKNSLVSKMLLTSAKILLHDNAKIAVKFKFETLESSVKPLNKKEKKQLDLIKIYTNAITAGLSEQVAVTNELFCNFSEITKNCNFNNLENVRVGLDLFFNTLLDFCKTHKVKSIMISLKNIKYKANLIDADLKMAIKLFQAENIKIFFTDCNKALNDMLRLHIKLAYNNGTPEEVLKFIKNLQLGRVVLLTKLKDHRSENLSYREKDEVIAQYIAIIKQISPDTVEFLYTGFDYLKTFHDQIARYGSPDEFDELMLARVSIPIADLGCTDIRIAKSWHLNLLNGDVMGSDEYNYITTYTSEVIRALQSPEKVVLPEFIRRSLRSWNIPFNERALLIDIQNFKKNLKKYK